MRNSQAIPLIGSLFVVLAATPSVAQTTVDIDPIAATFDDPTVLARSINQRLSSSLQACMNSGGFEYFVAPDARFELRTLELPDDTLRFDPSILELAPLVLDPGSLDSRFIDPSVLDRSALDDLQIDVDDLVAVTDVDPEFTVEEAVIPPIEALPIPVNPGLTAPDIRLEPTLEGYGVALDPLTALPPDPNLEFISSLDPGRLDDYEVALYGEPLAQIPPGAEVGGCAAEIDRILEDEIIPNLQSLTETFDRLFDEIESDDSYREQTQAWAACMEATDVGADLQLASPGESVALAQERFDQLDPANTRAVEQARDFEVTLATADYTCRQDTIEPAAAAVVLKTAGEVSLQSFEVIQEFGVSP